MATDRTDSVKKAGPTAAQHPAGRSDEPVAPTLSAARLAVASKRARAEAGSSASLLMAEPIAIVGMGCRFPGGADSPETYWRLLEEGRTGIRAMPEARWPSSGEALPPRLRMGGNLEQVDLFDPEFFGIAPREAHSIDPQQRLLLEVCWEALLDAGLAPSSLAGSDTGVFVAVYNTDYFRMQMREGAIFDAYTGVGAAHSVAAGRISFLLNLRGPCLAIDTACSSSLVATQLACQSLRQRECSAALVGGSSLKLLPDEVRIFAEWGMLSSDGRAKTFDASADGFVPGEGCGVIVLKRLSDAIAQGDPIRAVIRGGAVNHDGRSSVLTAPNGPAQEAVIRAALRDAHMQAGDVSFVETHGTGTSLGDPIEVEALDALYGAGSSAQAGLPCHLGAVKTNVGHLEASAGIAGLIKVVLALEHQAIPANLNFARLNPQIRLESGSRLKLANEKVPWPRSAQPRYAAVSSFGLGGTNAHILLEEAPLLPRLPDSVKGTTTESTAFCLPVSAHSAESLRILARAYVDLLRQPGADLRCIAVATARSRDHYDFRIAVVADTAADAANQLETRLREAKLEQARLEVVSLYGTASPDGPGKLAFVFSGQGSLWPGMMAALADCEEARKILAWAEPLVQASAGWSLRDAAEDAACLEDTARSQPILFVIQLGLLKTLEGWGIVPDAVAGHSVGEIAAAVAAGALTAEQGLELAVRRGACMASSEAGGEPGRMLAAEISLADAEAALCSFAGFGRLPEIAAINSPRSIVFSGPESSMQALAGQLVAKQVNTRWLDVRYAFHSAAMEAAAGALTGELRAKFPSGCAPRPTITLISTVTGQPWQSGNGDAGYWGRGIRRPVRFQHAIEELARIGCRTFVEVGPHPVLLRAVAATAAGVVPNSGRDFTVLGTMRRGQNAGATLLTAVARLYENGGQLKWVNIYPGQVAHTGLPGYPWMRERYWLASFPVRVAVRAEFALVPQGLLGTEIHSPFLDGRLWQISLSPANFPWLEEHRWQDKPIVPFAAWLEIARRAAGLVAGDDGVVLREFAVHKPLTLGGDPVLLQVLVSSSRELKLAAQVDGRWENYASGFWEAGEPVPTKSGDSIDLAEFTTAPMISPEAVYGELAANGLTYGPSFRLLRGVRRFADSALGEIAIDSGSTARGERGLPPTVLDACLQTLQAAQPAEFRDRAVLPLSVGSYRVVGLATELYSKVRMVSSSAVEAVADVCITDRQGGLIAEIQDLRVRRMQASVRPSARWEVGWRLCEEKSADPALEDSLPWVLPFADDLSGRLLSKIAQALEERNVRVDRRPWDSLLAVDSPSPVDARGPIRVLLAGGFSAVASQLLRVVKVEQARPGSVRTVCLVTGFAQAVAPGEAADPGQAALVALARTFRAEYPGISVLLLDLPVVTLAAGVSMDARRIAGWLCSQVGQGLAKSQEVALRRGRFFEARLEALSGTDHAELALEIMTRGLLETLRSVPATTPDPAAGEVQIACQVHGLNFRDVLTSLGTYPGLAAPLGAECAGIVVNVGSGVRIKPGTPVLAFAPASLRSRVNLRAEYVVPKPASMSFAEAATIPVAFLTAHYAFSRLAKLQPGETVLIHSAAGGLGQAAVQLAWRSGASVIATAGSVEKRGYLAGMGVAHVFDSRNVEFADEVLHATDGQGVDVVLNALSGDKIDAGFRALRQGGAFLEVGKRDIWTAEHAARVRPDARYWAFDLGEVAEQSPALIREMLEELLAEFAAGRLLPLPHEVFPIAQAEEAFRTMAGGRHVGKLVLTQPPLALEPEAWKGALQEGTVLISGGTGALGLATARWLIDQGARSLVLVSRRGANDAALQLQAESVERGVHVLVVRGDVSQRDELSAVLERARSLPSFPLRVVVHAAGEVEDCLLADQSDEAMQAAMHAKVEGAKLLAELTPQDDLLMTIYYSSVASLLGSAGQGGYAAANGYLDGLARQRSACGLRTLSVRWGAWTDGGMVERLSPSAQSRMHRQGVEPMKPASALAALGEAILAGQAVAAIVDVRWPAYLDQFPATSAAHGFFSDFLTQAVPDGIEPGCDSAGVGVGPSALNPAFEITAILAATRSERVPLMEAFVRSSARKVLGLSSGRPISLDTPLQELGLDSLMALELRNVLAHGLGRPLSATLLFDYPTVRGLAKHLLSLLAADSGTNSPSSASVNVAASAHGIRETSASTEVDLSGISDAEAEELLLAELDREGRR